MFVKNAGPNHPTRPHVFQYFTEQSLFLTVTYNFLILPLSLFKCSENSTKNGKFCNACQNIQQVKRILSPGNIQMLNFKTVHSLTNYYGMFIDVKKIMNKK